MTKRHTAPKKQQLATSILDLVREYANTAADEPPFIPGQTPIRYAGRVYGAEELVNLVDAALEFYLTAGRYADQLERQLAQHYGLRGCRLVNSGSSANLLAIGALTSHEWESRRLKPGDEVITVAAGFPSTVVPLIQYGLVPVFIDIDIPTYNADVSLLHAALSDRTRAVIFAHTLGNPFDLETVTVFCKKHDLWLIEDNCDANGSLYNGHKTGTFGDISTLSFYPPHHMTTGEGGAVLCKTPKMIRVIESLRDWGRDCWCAAGKDNTCGKRFEWQLGTLPDGYDHKYTYSHLGYNLKMTDLQAAIGLAQLARLDDFGQRRRENWQYFQTQLSDLSDYFVFPQPTTNSDPSWFGYMLLVRPESGLTRDAIVQQLEAKKIQTRMLFAGNLTRQPAFVTLAAQRHADGHAPPYRIATPLTRTDEVMNHAFWIGVYPGLTSAMREYVVTSLREIVATQHSA